MSNQTICDFDTPDPWMIAHGGRFYLTFTCGDRVEIWSSSNLENFRAPYGRKIIAWRPPKDHPWAIDLWAPELHYLQGRWYVYFAGAKPPRKPGNPSHRTLVLRCRGQDPMEEGSWEFIGQIRGMPDHWNIDATLFHLPRTDKLYCCYSGWPLGDFSDRQQDLFLTEMESPEVAKPETLICISRAELDWERADNGSHGVNEGPAFVSTGGFEGIVYSANGSWTSDYRLAVVQLVGDNPLDPASWRKRPTPLLVSDRQHGGPFGPGHASFINSPYGDGRVYCIYHATESEGDGWNNRKGRVLCFGKEHFQPQAGPMCCAKSLTGQWSGGASTSQHAQYPGNMSQPSQQAAHQPGQRKSLFDKIGDTALRKLREFTS
jgi:GH43 family beta-xylosidase